MGMTGANIASLDTVRRVASQTGSLAIETGSQTKAATATAKEEVDDVVRTLKTRFTSTLDRLETTADDADRQIAASGWEGSARETALEASAEFRSGILQLSEQSRTSLEEFSQALDTQVVALNEELSARFTTLMTQAQESFEAYARSVSAYSSDLQATDNSVKLR